MPVGYTVLSTSTVDRTRHYTSGNIFFGIWMLGRIRSETILNPNFFTFLGNYSELLACITFRRSSGHYAILLFFPVSSMVLTAWIISWNYWDAAFTELVLLTISILSIHMFFRFRLVSVVSYITLTDFYLFVCFILVFVCLCKVMFWKCLLRRRKKLAEDRKKSSSDGIQYSMISTQKRNSMKHRLFRPERPYKVIHVISHLFILIVLSICFILLVLWPTIGNESKRHSAC